MSVLLDGFLVRATLAALGVALAAAPLGCFVVWRRMAYFGDAIAHAAILGIALSLALSLPVFPAVLAAALLMSVAVSLLSGRTMAEDTALGVLAHGALAVGLVAVSLVPGVRVDLTAYLLGDILSVGRSDLLIIWGGAILVVALMTWQWSALLTATLDADLAQAAGIDARRSQLILTVGLAITVAVAIKIVGVLLVAALLVVPPAAARPFARTPEAMAVLAAGIGALSAVSGVAISWQLDTPTGPSIVSAAAFIFAVSQIASRRLDSR